MKNLSLIFLMVLTYIVTVSCENKGPKSHAIYPDISIDEQANEVIDAVANDSYYYKCSVELYYLDDGEWEYYGMGDVYCYPNSKDKCKDWVEFGNDLMPAYFTDKGGYSFCVRYKGVDYYY